jgi:5'-nucleotidase
MKDLHLPPVFVLTNDDGVDAPGLAALDKATGGRGIIVAPRDHLSGCSHQVTVDRPIHVDQRDERIYAVDGTPADCVRLALRHLAPEAALVLSGINRGGNLGADLYLSGTVAAVREAAFQRVPGIALSQYLRRGVPLDWDHAAAMAERVLKLLLDTPLDPGSFLNVNLPHLDDPDSLPLLAECRPCTQPLPTEYEIEGEHYHYVLGLYQSRQCDTGSDVEACFGGKITVTRHGV